MDIEDFKIVIHGIGHSQYFQGASLAFGQWKDCATGVGPDELTAFDDAMDSICQNGWEWPVRSEIADRLNAREKAFRARWQEDLKALREAMNCHCEGDGCEQCEDSELYWHVTVYVR